MAAARKTPKAKANSARKAVKPAKGKAKIPTKSLPKRVTNDGRNKETNLAVQSGNAKPKRAKNAVQPPKGKAKSPKKGSPKIVINDGRKKETYMANNNDNDKEVENEEGEEEEENNETEAVENEEGEEEEKPRSKRRRGGSRKGGAIYGSNVGCLSEETKLMVNEVEINVRMHHIPSKAEGFKFSHIGVEDDNPFLISNLEDIDQFNAQHVLKLWCAFAFECRKPRKTMLKMKKLDGTEEVVCKPAAASAPVLRLAAALVVRFAYYGKTLPMEFGRVSLARLPGIYGNKFAFKRTTELVYAMNTLCRFLQEDETPWHFVELFCFGTTLQYLKDRFRKPTEAPIGWFKDNQEFDSHRYGLHIDLKIYFDLFGIKLLPNI